MVLREYLVLACAQPRRGPAVSSPAGTEKCSATAPPTLCAASQVARKALCTKRIALCVGRGYRGWVCFEFLPYAPASTVMRLALAEFLKKLEREKGEAAGQKS